MAESAAQATGLQRFRVVCRRSCSPSVYRWREHTQHAKERKTPSPLTHLRALRADEVERRARPPANDPDRLCTTGAVWTVRLCILSSGSIYAVAPLATVPKVQHGRRRHAATATAGHYDCGEYLKRGDSCTATAIISAADTPQRPWQRDEAWQPAVVTTGPLTCGSAKRRVSVGMYLTLSLSMPSMSGTCSGRVRQCTDYTVPHCSTNTHTHCSSLARMIVAHPYCEYSLTRMISARHGVREPTRAHVACTCTTSVCVDM